MPGPPTTPIWTLTAKHTHGTFGQLLVGCHIIENDTSTGYNFTQPNPSNPSNVLASSPGPSLPTGKFTFTPAFDYNGLTNVVIGMDIPVASGTNWKGTWTCTDSPPMKDVPPPQGAQSGDFTAQAGSGLGEGEAASSAKA